MSAKEIHYTIKPNVGITLDLTPDKIEGYTCIGVVAFNTGDYNTFVVSLSATYVSLCNKGSVEVAPKGSVHFLYLKSK